MKTGRTPPRTRGWGLRHGRNPRNSTQMFRCTYVTHHRCDVAPAAQHATGGPRTRVTLAIGDCASPLRWSAGRGITGVCLLANTARAVVTRCSATMLRRKFTESLSRSRGVACIRMRSLRGTQYDVVPSHASTLSAESIREILQPSAPVAFFRVGDTLRPLQRPRQRTMSSLGVRSEYHHHSLEDSRKQCRCYHFTSSLGPVSDAWTVFSVSIPSSRTQETSETIWSSRAKTKSTSQNCDMVRSSVI